MSREPLRFLFAAQGYPGVPGTSSGSGVGTYVREICLGLTARGHRCHVMVWSDTGRGWEAEHEGVAVHAVPKGHWPVVERWWPDSRNEWRRGQLAARLDRRHRFDWVEIQSDEGVDHRLQRRFRGRVVLRTHTTLLQMCRYKEVTPNRLTPRWLAREKRSLEVADRIVTHSPAHAAELLALFPGIAAPRVVPHGFGSPTAAAPPPAGGDRTLFLTVGTFDLRKGTDRLRAVATEYARRHGPCELRLVSPSPEGELGGRFGLTPIDVPGVTVRYLTRLSPEELAQEYRTATVYLHLARYESFGLPLIEAASCGTPVVATRTGIAPELLSDESADLLVSGDDPADCVRALHQAATARGVYGGRVRDTYARHFTRDRMTERYLETLADWETRQTAVTPNQMVTT